MLESIHSTRRKMKTSTAATAAIFLTALSAAAAAAAASGTADTRLPSRTELESVGRRDIMTLGRNSTGSTVTYLLLWPKNINIDIRFELCSFSSKSTTF